MGGPVRAGAGLWACVALAAGGCVRGHRALRPDASMDRSPALFIDVAREAGIAFIHDNGAHGDYYYIETFGGGCAFLDYDADGWPDLFLLQSGPLPHPRKAAPAAAGPERGGRTQGNALYRNNRGGTFTDVTRTSGLERTGYGFGAAVGDVDNDGFDDLFITSYPRCRLFRNLRGSGRFQDVTAQAGVAGAGRWPTSAAFVDYDRDGFLDLYVCRYVSWSPASNRDCRNPADRKSYCAPDLYEGDTDALYRNNGDGTFREVTGEAGIEHIRRRGLGVASLDYNDDGWIDLYVANDRQPNTLLRNNRDGTLTDVGTEAGASFGSRGAPLAGMGVAVADYDNDGREDLFVTNFSGEPNSLYRNEGKGLFTEVGASARLAAASTPFLAFGCEFIDYDRDGFRDILAGNGHTNDDVEQFVAGVAYREPKQLFRNAGDGTFTEVISGMGDLARPCVTRGLAVGDYDNDGDLDVLASNQNDAVQLLRNEDRSANHWIAIRTIGVRSNRDGAHAKITLRCGARTFFGTVRSGSSYCAHSDRRVYFGLGSAAKVDELAIRWPGGLRERLTNVPVDRALVVTEGRGVTGPPAAAPLGRG